MSDYLKYRGKCKEFAEALSKENGYTLVRGWYYDPIWNREEAHWWCVDAEGNIHDPTSKQFPSGGVAEFYRPFEGYFECAECGAKVKEADVVDMGNSYTVCSDRCALALVGLA